MSATKRKPHKVRYHTCVYCNIEFSLYNIGAHVKNVHGIDPEAYKLEQGITISKEARAERRLINRLNSRVDTYLKRNPGTNGDLLFNYMYLCTKFDIPINLKWFGFIDTYFDYNGDIDKYINHTLALVHYPGPRNTTREWLSLTKGEEYANEYFDNLSKRTSGKNNPAYQHGGGLSPFSKKFVKYDDLSEKEKEEQISNIQNKMHDKMREEGNYSTKIEYWLNKGYTEEEANNKLSERQTTFTLDKCIARYGEEKGTDIWVDRQRRWQKSCTDTAMNNMFNLDNNEEEDRNLSIPFTLIQNDDIKCTTYILHIPNNFIKVGMTINNIYDRYSAKLIDSLEDHFVSEIYTIKKCFLVEQIIKNKYKNNHIDYEERVEGFGWTETLKDVSFDEIKSYMDELLLLDEEELLGMYYAIRDS